jgi:hypothetical protein
VWRTALAGGLMDFELIYAMFHSSEDRNESRWNQHNPYRGGKRRMKMFRSNLDG